MAAPGTSFAGPLISGPRQSADNSGPANAGYAILTQTAVLTQNSTNNVSATFTLPPNSQILDFLVDTTTAWNSATSAGLTIGTAALGTQYVSSIDVKANASPRAALAPTTAQLAAMADINTNTSVVATVAVVGATSAGTTRVTIRYVQTVDWMS